jgi:hypothetical protein
VSLGLENLRSGGPDCPSDLALDRLCAGELGPAVAARIEEHASSCADCAARRNERGAGFQAHAGFDERKVLAGIRRGLDAPASKPAGQFRALVLLFTACAVGLVAFSLDRRPAVDALRSKGGLALHVFRAHGAKAEAMVSGDRFAPGDRLEFAVDLPGAGYVQVFGIEQGGALYTAWPLQTSAPPRLGPGRGIVLPGAVALDGSLGRESLFLVHCPLEAGPPRCTAGPNGADALQCQPACALTRFVLEKQR